MVVGGRCGKGRLGCSVQDRKIIPTAALYEAVRQFISLTFSSLLCSSEFGGSIGQFSSFKNICGAELKSLVREFVVRVSDN